MVNTNSCSGKVICSTRRCILHLGRLVTILVFFFNSELHAASGITYHGRILRPNGMTPVNSMTTQFRIQVRTPGVENCLLWEEQQTKDLSSTAGVFTITIADSAEPTLLANTLPFTLERVFSNRTAFTGLTNCNSGTSYTPSTSVDGRNLQVFFREAPTDAWEQMPATKINFVPLALNSVQLEGFASAEFLKVASNSVYTPLTAGNVNTLLDLIAGTNAQYLTPSTAFLGDVTGTSGATVVNRIRGTNVVATAPTLNQVLKFDGTNWVPAADATGGAPVDSSYAAKGIVQIDTSLATSGLNVAAGVLSLPNVIIAGGPIGSTSVTPVITYDAKGRLTAVTSATINDASKLPLTGGVMTGSIDMGTFNITNATSLASTNVSTRNLLLSDNDTNTITVRAPVDVTPVNYSLTLPATAGTAGYVLSTDGTGNLSWIIPSTGSVTSVSSANPYITVGTGTTTPLITAVVGQLANTLAAGNDNRIVNAVQQAAYSADLLPVATCAANQKPSWNTVSDAWECLAISGFVTTATGFVQDGNSFAAPATLGTNDAQALNFETGGTTKMTVLNNGNVGIGTTSPSSPLSVTPAQYITGTASQSLTTVTGVGTLWTAAMVGSQFVFANGVSAGTITAVSSATSMTVSASQSVLSQAYTIGYTGLQVAATGNVGIGTASPAANLDVNGSARIGNLMTNTTSAAVDYAYPWEALGPSSNGFNFRLQSPNGIFFHTNMTATEADDNSKVRMYIGSNGSVGINTAAPLSLFDVNGSVAFGSYAATNVAPANGLIVSGNVGIGTPTPGAKLEVAGQIKITGGVPGAGKVLQSDATGLASWATLGGSESTAVSNVGTAGVGVYKQMTGSTIELKNINAATSAISITNDVAANEIDIGVNAELAGLSGLATNGFVKRTGAGAYASSAALDLTTDVTGTLPIANGGTGQITANAALNALLPAQATHAGKFLYTNATTTSWVEGVLLADYIADVAPAALCTTVQTPYYNTGTGLWACQNINFGAAAPTLSSITAATAANSINNGDFAQSWNWSLTTAAQSALKITENTASINGAGAQYLVDIGTIAASTASPLRVQARGIDVINVSASGALNINSNAAIGTTVGQNINITSGAALPLYKAGDITIKGGSGAAGGGTSVVTLQGSDGSSAVAGAIYLKGGNAGAAGTSTGGMAYVQGGTANATAGSSGGGVSITGANGFTGGNGGAIAMSSGVGGNASFGNGLPAGNITIAAGAGGSSTSSFVGAAGALVNITAGNGGAGNGTGAGGLGGNLNLSAGNAGAIGNVNGGDIVLNGGTKTGTGADGRVVLATLRGNVGIGTANPDVAAKLEVAGQIKITGGVPGAGKVLQSDATGLASWATLGGSESTSVTNIGTAGVGVFKQLTGANIELKKINAGSTAITVTDDVANNELDIGVNAELAGLSGLAANGFVKRTGAGTYASSASVALGTDVTGTLPIANGGTGQIAANAALNALLPAQATHAGKFLSTNATSTSWVEGVLLADYNADVLPAASCTTIQTPYYNTVSGLWTCQNINIASAGGFVDGGNTFTATATLGTNSAHNLEIETGGTTKMTILNNGNVGIGTNNPGWPLQIVRADTTNILEIRNTSSTASRFPGLNVSNYMGTFGGTPKMSLYNSRGAEGAAGTLTAGDQLGIIEFYGAHDVFNGFSRGAQIRAIAEENFSASVNGGTYLTFSTANLGTSADTEKLRITAKGNVMIGSAIPRAKLDVNGSIVSKASTSNATATINFDEGNIQHTALNCGSFNLWNLKDGGSYTFIVKGTTPAVCAFTGFSESGTGPLTVKMPPDNGLTTNAKHTVFNLVVSGTDVYVAWTPGY